MWVPISFYVELYRVCPLDPRRLGSDSTLHQPNGLNRELPGVGECVTDSDSPHRIGALSGIGLAMTVRLSGVDHPTRDYSVTCLYAGVPTRIVERGLPARVRLGPPRSYDSLAGAFQRHLTRLLTPGVSDHTLVRKAPQGAGEWSLIRGLPTKLLSRTGFPAVVLDRTVVAVRFRERTPVAGSQYGNPLFVNPLVKLSRGSSRRFHGGTRQSDRGNHSLMAS